MTKSQLFENHPLLVSSVYSEFDGLRQVSRKLSKRKTQSDQNLPIKALILQHFLQGKLYKKQCNVVINFNSLKHICKLLYTLSNNITFVISTFQHLDSCTYTSHSFDSWTKQFVVFAGWMLCCPVVSYQWSVVSGQAVSHIG